MMLNDALGMGGGTRNGPQRPVTLYNLPFLEPPLLKGRRLPGLRGGGKLFFAGGIFHLRFKWGML